MEEEDEDEEKGEEDEQELEEEGEQEGVKDLLRPVSFTQRHKHLYFDVNEM